LPETQRASSAPKRLLHQVYRQRTGAICTVLTGGCIVVWDMSFGKERYFRDVTFTE
jgi:hypothetical protein